MYCGKCGSQIKDTAKFCPKCGTPVKARSAFQANTGGVSPSGMPPAEPPVSGGTGTRKSSGRNRKKKNPWVIPAAALALALLCGGGFAAYRLLSDAGEPAVSAEKERGDAEAKEAAEEKETAEEKEAEKTEEAEEAEGSTLARAMPAETPETPDVPEETEGSGVVVSETAAAAEETEPAAAQAAAPTGEPLTLPAEMPETGTAFAEAPQQQTVTTMRVVNCREWISLRSAPSTGAPAITTIPLGETVTYLGSASGGFYQVSWQGRTGYALAEYLQIVR